MNGLYIGIRTPGTTSQLRCDTFPRVAPEITWTAIDTDAVFRKTPQWAQSLAFRLRTGPAVTAVNKYILTHLKRQTFDIAWIDKGVCLWPKTVRRVREMSRRMIYYTPDTSFEANRSRYFNQTAALYDLVVTTKSFERLAYQRILPSDRIMIVTQSYDDTAHQPVCRFEDKRKEAVLIGLHEPDRQKCIEHLLAVGIPVRLGGRGWQSFVDRHAGNSELIYEGSTVFGDQYVNCLSSAAVGLGLVTKRFRELHTTRTFEIPACGTALATERNAETSTYFDDDDVIFFDNYSQLAEKIKTLLNDDSKLAEITSRGTHRITSGRYSNAQIITDILSVVGLPVSSDW